MLLGAQGVSNEAPRSFAPRSYEAQSSIRAKAVDRSYSLGAAMIYVYVLECKAPRTYYVGLTKYPRKRMLKHMRKACKFTREHGVKSIACVLPFETEEHAYLAENSITLALHSLGLNVAGGMWVEHRALLSSMSQLFNKALPKHDMRSNKKLLENHCMIL